MADLEAQVFSLVHLGGTAVSSKKLISIPGKMVYETGLHALERLGCADSGFSDT